MEILDVHRKVIRGGCFRHCRKTECGTRCREVGVSRVQLWRERSALDDFEEGMILVGDVARFENIHRFLRLYIFILVFLFFSLFFLA